MCHRRGASPASLVVRPTSSGVPGCREGLSEVVASVVFFVGAGDGADKRQCLGRQGAESFAVASDTVEAVEIANLAPVVKFAVFKHTLYQLCGVAFCIEVVLVDVPKEIGRQLADEDLCALHILYYRGRHPGQGVPP